MDADFDIVKVPKDDSNQKTMFVIKPIGITHIIAKIIHMIFLEKSG